DDADEHRRRADNRVNQELHRRILATAGAPDADDQEHRDQLDLPEEEEEEEVERQENPKNARLEQQEEDEVFLGPVRDIPGYKDRQQEKAGRYDQHRQAQPID